MRNRKAIIFLTIIVTLLCLYNLSFTFISRSWQERAIEESTDSNGKVDLNKKQKFLDSIYREPIVSFLGLDYKAKPLDDRSSGGTDGDN